MKAHQEAKGRRKNKRTRRQRKPSDSQSQIDERMRRKRAVEKAKKRKARLKYIIEKAARNSPDFIGALASEGLTLIHDPKKGTCVRMVDSDGKERQYGLQKYIGIDMSILPATVLAPSPSKQSRPTYSPSKLKHNSGIKDAPSDSSRNAEHEIRDSHSSDDLDDEWKRRNGYKM